MELPDTLAGAGGEDQKNRPLNSWVAVAVVVLACFMAITKVKDDNLVQAMLQAKSDEVDAWNDYQAKSTKQHLAEAARDLLVAEKAAGPARRYAEEVARYEREKADLQAQAEALRRQYDAYNYDDDQFDVSDAALSLALALLGITALTQKRWLFWTAAGLGAFGLLMGLAGFLNLGLHPAALSRLLGT